VGGLTVTTSWDDGHRLDAALADRLREHRLPGTFYVAPHNRELARDDRLPAGDLRDLAADFEIGSHTVTHPVLTRLPDAQAESEIVESRRLLADLLGSSVDTFCYPRGAFTSTHVRMVERAGYRYARTVRGLATGIADPLRAPTTIETGRFALLRTPVELANAARLTGSWSLVGSGRWDDIAIAVFDRCLVTGGVFHLWGHSWVLERRGEWNRLDRVLSHIAARPGVRYVANGELGRQPGGPGMPGDAT